MCWPEVGIPEATPNFTGCLDWVVGGEIISLTTSMYYTLECGPDTGKKKTTTVQHMYTKT